MAHPDLSLDTVRLFLHVLAATIWVGGQLTLGGLVGALRTASPDAPGAAARAYNRIAWPAFLVLVLTGIWNMAAVEGDSAYQSVLGAKMALVAVSGATAYAHTRASTPKSRGITGGLSALSAVAALFLGLVLAG